MKENLWFSFIVVLAILDKCHLFLFQLNHYYIFFSLFSFTILLQTNQEKINMIKTQNNFSKSFNILLSPKQIDIDSNMIDANNIKNGENGNDRSKQLRQYLNNIIEAETETTEDRIERYRKQQMAALKSFIERAELDYLEILRYGFFNFTSQFLFSIKLC